MKSEAEMKTRQSELRFPFISVTTGFPKFKPKSLRVKVNNGKIQL